jgi:hypothetical protein
MCSVSSAFRFGGSPVSSASRPLWLEDEVEHEIHRGSEVELGVQLRGIAQAHGLRRDTGIDAGADQAPPGLTHAGQRDSRVVLYRFDELFRYEAEPRVTVPKRSLVVLEKMAQADRKHQIGHVASIQTVHRIVVPDLSTVRVVFPHCLWRSDVPRCQ